MGGLARLCKLYGSLLFTDNEGNTVTYYWDYVNEKPRLKTDMTSEEIGASEKAKWVAVKRDLDNIKNKQDASKN